MQKEKENFPDLAALEEETGSCDDSSANQTMVAYQAQYESHLLSAMQQVRLRPLAGGLDCRLGKGGNGGQAWRWPRESESPTSVHTRRIACLPPPSS